MRIERMPEPSDAARAVFARLFERIDRGEHVDFEAEVARAGPLADELRALEAGWRRAEAAFAVISEHAGDVRPLGDEATEGPGVPLDAEAQAVLERLGGKERSSSRYERLELVARGGMGDVWRVRDHDLGREVAMKVVRASHGPTARRRTASLLERFLQEARLLARLDHPGILPLHDVGLDDEARVWFTLPFVRGDTLADVLARGPACDAPVIEILLRVCDALAYAHAQDVVHRDLKPSNVLVGRFGEAYVADWGLALSGTHASRSGGDGSAPRRASETLHGEIVGTPAYMPPEQAAGIQAELDPRADVYSIGAILYHALSGRAPYADLKRSSEILAAVRNGPPESIASAAPEAPVELAAICARAMQREPQDRYPSVAALADDLRAYLTGRVVRAHRTGALPELAAWTRRNRPLALALSGVLILATAGLIARSLQRERTAREVLRMADVARLSDLQERAKQLSVADASRSAEFDAWILDAQELASHRVLHEASLRELADRAVLAADGLPRFPTDEDRWRHEVLAGLVDGLERLENPDPTQGDIARVHHLRSTALQLERSLVDALPLWEKTNADISDPIRSPYVDLYLEPQHGLVPLGRDPQSELQEFAHVASGAVPIRRADGQLEIGAESCIVLVLVPGGRFRMGANAGTWPEQPDVDAYARPGEGPRRDVEVGPFFVAKHELSRAQWKRAAHRDPSWHSRADGPEIVDLLPLESVDWGDARQALRDLGLSLPTEAQWEYASRGGATTRWWTGQEPGTLRGAVNGKSAADPRRQDVARGHKEMPAALMKISELSANGFGLYHVLGNVAEWTLDPWSDVPTEGLRTGDGLRAGPDLGMRCVRGGDYTSDASGLRCAARKSVQVELRDRYVGIRAVRAIDR